MKLVFIKIILLFSIVYIVQFLIFGNEYVSSTGKTLYAKVLPIAKRACDAISSGYDCAESWYQQSAMGCDYMDQNCFPLSSVYDGYGSFGKYGACEPYMYIRRNLECPCLAAKNATTTDKESSTTTATVSPTATTKEEDATTEEDDVTTIVVTTKKKKKTKTTTDATTTKETTTTTDATTAEEDDATTADVTTTNVTTTTMDVTTAEEDDATTADVATTEDDDIVSSSSSDDEHTTSTTSTTISTSTTSGTTSTTSGTTSTTSGKTSTTSGTTSTTSGTTSTTSGTTSTTSGTTSTTSGTTSTTSGTTETTKTTSGTTKTTSGTTKTTSGTTKTTRSTTKTTRSTTKTTSGTTKTTSGTTKSTSGTTKTTSGTTTPIETTAMSGTPTTRADTLRRTITIGTTKGSAPGNDPVNRVLAIANKAKTIGVIKKPDTSPVAQYRSILHLKSQNRYPNSDTSKSSTLGAISTVPRGTQVDAALKYITLELKKYTTLRSNKFATSELTTKFTTNLATDKVCQSDFILLGETCYLFSKHKLPWVDAFTFCQQRGASLAHPKNDIENKLLDNYLKSHFPPNDWFLGAHDHMTEEDPPSWIWVHDKSKLDFGNWVPNHPDDKHTNEDCLVYTTKFDNGWKDVFCKTCQYFICQQELMLKCF